jgi:uncharacterized protein YggU (UPF0235/DUF167 family)
VWLSSVRITRRIITASIIFPYWPPALQSLTCWPFPSAVKTIQVKVKPGARVSLFHEQADGSWLAQLKSPPVDGKANKELIALIAGHFGCTKSSIKIKSGQSSKLKLIQFPAD